MAAIKYVFAKDAADLDKIQGKAIKSVQKARELVQIAAVATIKHTFDHGDWTYAQKLVDGLGNTVNGMALVEWFKVYGGLTVTEEGFNGWSGKEHIHDNFQAAKDTMWWELKKANPFKGYSLEQQLQQLIKNHNAMLRRKEQMPEEDQAKINVEVNDATIQAVLSLCNFEAIINV